MFKHMLLGSLLTIGLVSALAIGPADRDEHVQEQQEQHEKARQIEHDIMMLQDQLHELMLLRQEFMQQQIDQLIEEGRHEEAEALAHSFQREMGRLGPRQESDRRGIGMGRNMPPEIMELRRKIEHLHQEGAHEEAEHLEIMLQAHLEMNPVTGRAIGGTRPGLDPDHRELEEIEHKIIALHEHGRHEEARALEHELKAIIEHHPSARGRGIGGGAGRGGSGGVGGGAGFSHGPDNEWEWQIHHLHIAAENLHEAGLHDAAEDVMREAERIEREHFECEHREHFGHMPPMEEVIHLIEELRHEVNELREIVDELHHFLEELED